MCEEFLRFDWRNLPRGHGDDGPLPAARLKCRPDDFVVEEIPLYEPCGDGEHLFLFVEKRDTSAGQFARHLARSLGIRTRDIGIAGRKDRRAITRQWVSVPAACSAQVASIDDDAIRVLDSRRHTNKLRTGHLLGNRFRIRVQLDSVDGPELDSVRLRWQAIVSSVGRTGIPNYFGEQRFGNFGDTALLGMGLLQPERYPNQSPSRSHHARRLFLSAVQSAVFNRVLAVRIGQELFDSVLAGDVMQFDRSHAIFTVEDAAAEEDRFRSGETVTTGPMWGVRMPRAAGRVAEIEQAGLADCGLTERDLAAWRRAIPGTRRPLRVFAKDFQFQFEDGAAVFCFELPAGAYATVVLREFLGSWQLPPTSGDPPESAAV